ncbi:MAG: hypothetical protein A3C56_10330 [Ignavibacteria bacterium RIFCSPHIGHO2_02_FULL_56_12]|nr:MAG: hypothetical protein A3C56_10330 [Ignavibacteria bacterium RIFCSPHIGHO2_02_FULL_56_12]
MPSSLTIYHLSGRPEVLRAAAASIAGDASLVLRPFEEKKITSPSLVRSALREGRHEAVAFGCKDLTLQRFQVALKFYLLFFGSGSRFLVDEGGQIITVSWSSFLFVDVSRFILEAIASLAVLLHAWARLPRLKRSYGERP